MLTQHVPVVCFDRPLGAESTKFEDWEDLEISGRRRGGHRRETGSTTTTGSLVFTYASGPTQSHFGFQPLQCGH